MIARSPVAKDPLTLFAVFIACLLVAWTSSVHSLDFNVYRAGARAYLGLDGSTNLYDAQLWHISGDSWLPFTYPPFAILLFLPYALIPAVLGAYIHTAILILSMLVVVHFMIVKTCRLNSFLKTTSVWLHAGILGSIVFAIGFAGPWREGMSFGQINAILMAAILFDLLADRRGRLPRGLITGIAAGVKLTPLAFGLLFLAERDWKAIMWMAVGFVGSVAVGFALTVQGSIHYWTEAIFATTRIGDSADMYTVTLNSFTQHLGLQDQTASLLWLVLSFLTIIGGYAAIRELLRADERLAAIGASAIVMLMISPISWYHHWVWFVLFLPPLLFPARLTQRKPRMRAIAIAAVTYVTFLFSSYALSILYYGTIQGTGPWWLELISSIWMFVAVGLVVTLVHANSSRAFLTSERQ